MSAFIYPPGTSYPPSGVTLETSAAVLSFPSAAAAVVANGTYQLSLAWPWQVGTITGLTAVTAAGSFTAAVLIGGIPVGGLSAVAVAGAPAVTTPATSANALVAGNTLTLVISAATGSPTDATLQVNFTHSQV